MAPGGGGGGVVSPPTHDVRDLSADPKITIAHAVRRIVKAEALIVFMESPPPPDGR